MDIYHYEPDTGAYIGPGQADESPLEPGVYHIPAHATDVAPPDAPAGYEARFLASVWSLVALPQEPSPPVVTLADAQALAIQSIKAEAGRIILARLPQHKQANMTARAVDLLSQGATASQEWLDIQAAWSWVQAVRTASDDGEAAVIAATAIDGADAALVAARVAMATI